MLAPAGQYIVSRGFNTVPRKKRVCCGEKTCRHFFKILVLEINNRWRFHICWKYNLKVPVNVKCLHRFIFPTTAIPQFLMQLTRPPNHQTKVPGAPTTILAKNFGNIRTTKYYKTENFTAIVGMILPLYSFFFKRRN